MARNTKRPRGGGEEREEVERRQRKTEEMEMTERKQLRRQILFRVKTLKQSAMTFKTERLAYSWKLQTCVCEWRHGGVPALIGLLGE